MTPNTTTRPLLVSWLHETCYDVKTWPGCQLAAAVTRLARVFVATHARRVNHPAELSRRSRGPATGRQAWLAARSSLPLVATGDRGLLCVELTASSLRIETLASLLTPPPAPTTSSFTAETGQQTEVEALNSERRRVKKKLSVHHSSPHESTLMMSHATLPAAHTQLYCITNFCIKDLIY